MTMYRSQVIDSQLLALPTVDTASGSIATFDTDMTENLVEVKCQIVAQQSGSGTPSPSNPRPITVYTSLNLSHSGSDTSNPTVYNISFGQTVAQGLLNVGTGVLEITHGYVDLGSLNWAYTNVFVGESISPVKARGEDFVIDKPYTNSGIVISGDMPDKSLQLVNNQIWVKDSAYSDATTFKTAMNGVYLVYELATPQEIQLDSITLQALLNENNIWCDTGDISECKYIQTLGNKYL